MCRIFFQPDGEHREGAWQNIPLKDACEMIVASELAALIMDCMDPKLYSEK